LPRQRPEKRMRRELRQFARRDAGQSLLETALIMPLMLLIILNVINFGYFFLVAINVAAAPRSGVGYAILGFDTPGALGLPDANPPSTTNTISYLIQQDLSTLNNYTGASLQICTQTNTNPSTGAGLNGTGAAQKANCVTCTGSTCGTVGTGSPVPDADPEAPLFVLFRVDVDYSISPLIPGRPFGLLLLPLPTCSAGAGGVKCGFHRQVSMREM
jgi:hypothetical protein